VAPGTILARRNAQAAVAGCIIAVNAKGNGNSSATTWLELLAATTDV